MSIELTPEEKQAVKNYNKEVEKWDVSARTYVENANIFNAQIGTKPITFEEIDNKLAEWMKLERDFIQLHRTRSDFYADPEKLMNAGISPNTPSQSIYSQVFAVSKDIQNKRDALIKALSTPISEANSEPMAPFQAEATKTIKNETTLEIPAEPVDPEIHTSDETLTSASTEMPSEVSAQSPIGPDNIEPSGKATTSANIEVPAPLSADKITSTSNRPSELEVNTGLHEFKEAPAAHPLNTPPFSRSPSESDSDSDTIFDEENPFEDTHAPLEPEAESPVADPPQTASQTGMETKTVSETLSFEERVRENQVQQQEQQAAQEQAQQPRKLGSQNPIDENDDNAIREARLARFSPPQKEAASPTVGQDTIGSEHDNVETLSDGTLSEIDDLEISSNSDTSSDTSTVDNSGPEDNLKEAPLIGPTPGIAATSSEEEKAPKDKTPEEKIKFNVDFLCLPVIDFVKLKKDIQEKVFKGKTDDLEFLGINSIITKLETCHKQHILNQSDLQEYRNNNEALKQFLLSRPEPGFHELITTPQTEINAKKSIDLVSSGGYRFTFDHEKCSTSFDGKSMRSAIASIHKTRTEKFCSLFMPEGKAFFTLRQKQETAAAQFIMDQIDQVVASQEAKGTPWSKIKLKFTDLSDTMSIVAVQYVQKAYGIKNIELDSLGKKALHEIKAAEVPPHLQKAVETHTKVIQGNPISREILISDPDTCHSKDKRAQILSHSAEQKRAEAEKVKTASSENATPVPQHPH